MGTVDKNTMSEYTYNRATREPPSASKKVSKIRNYFINPQYTNYRKKILTLIKNGQQSQKQR